MSNTKRSWLCQMCKDWPASQGLSWGLHTEQKNEANTHTPPDSRHYSANMHPGPHSLTRVALAAWFLNLSPGREWKMCHRHYLLRSYKQRSLTAGCIAPLCSMMQRGEQGWPAVIYLLCCGVYRGIQGGGTHWNHSAQEHFAVVRDPELCCVASLYLPLACGVRSSTSSLSAAWLRVKHKSNKLY